MSYWNHAPDYYDRQSQLNELNPARFFADNYGNKTYWATLNVQQLSPRSWQSSVRPPSKWRKDGDGFVFE